MSETDTLLRGRKRRVEECAWILRVDQFRRDYLSQCASRPIVFKVRWGDDEPVLFESASKPTWLADRCPRDWQMRVQLEAKPWPIYGMRLFFRCSSCDRRCDALYAPHVGLPFHCRLCYDLSYASAQEWDNVKRTGRCPGVIGRILDEIEAGGDGVGALRHYVSRE